MYFWYFSEQVKELLFDLQENETLNDLF